LEANPDLTWLDFQYILKLSARRNDPSHPSWHENGAGFWVSHVYGFGIIDADKAVSLAVRWKEKPHIEEIHRTYETADKQHFPKAQGYGGGERVIECEKEVSDKNDLLFVHHIEVKVNIQHQRRGNLEIRLKSPYGTESILAEEHNDATPDYKDWKFTSLQAWGEGSVGKWILTITDKNTKSPDTTALLIDWTLTLHGIANFTIYKDLYGTGEESSVWDLRGGPIDQSSQPDSKSDWFQSTTDSVWKIGFLVTLICGIFLVVVIFIVIFIVRRVKADKNNLQLPTKIDDMIVQLESESSNSL